MDCETFEVIGRYELDRGLQDKQYDLLVGNLPRDYMVSSEWGLPPQFENGIVLRRPVVEQIWTQAAFLELARTQERADH